MRSTALALLAVLLGALVVGCGGSNDEAASPPETTTGVPPAETSREAAPALDGITLAGEPIAIGDFRGRPVLVNVWSSW
jgi:hypothetical protein